MGDERSETLTLRRERSQPDDHAATEAGTEASEPDPLIDRGTSLGRYVILETLGEGGMGVVYAAYDPELDRRIAIKLLRHSTSTEGNARLLREARAMARLNHRNVATVHDVGTVDGSVFIAMEFLEGETLKDHLAAHTGTKRLDFKEVLRLFLAAAEGLAAAHRAGFIHRDFKPENVMLTKDGRVVVLDFGLAAPPAEGTSSSDLSEAPFDGSSLTATGTIMGTPAYMSPEQMSGKAVGPASDQFSFCVALFEGLFGERPYHGDNYVELFDNLSSGDRRARPDTRDVPGWVQRAVDRGLEVSPDDRFATMSELIAALRDDPSIRRRRILVPAVAATGAITLAAIGWFATPEPDDPCADATATMGDVYGDDQREAIRAMGPDAGPRLVERLDRYAEHWAEARSASCHANRVRHEETDELHDRRLVCLEERLYALESFIARLTESGDVSAALMRSSRLPAVELCEIDAFVLADVPPPTNREVALEVRDIRRQMALETRRSHMVGAIAAKNNSTPLLERARATGYGPVVAEVLADEARMAHIKSDPAAKELALEALLTAERHRHDRIVFKCLQLLARIETHLQRRGRAEEHLERAAAVLNRLGNPEVLQLSLLRSTAELAIRGYDPGKARQALERALEIRRANGTYDKLWSVTDSAILAEACLVQRDYECGRTSANHALEVARTELGPLHPTLGELNVIAGNVHLDEGNAKAALERYAEASERFVASDESAYNRAALSNQAAQARVVAGQLEEAEREFKAGIRLAGQNLDASEPNFVGMRSNYLEFLLEHGRAAEACPQLEEVQRLARSTIERQWSIGRTSAALWGDCLRINGDPGGARAAYERATGLSEHDTTDQGYVMGFVGLARLDLQDGNLEAAEANARRGTAVDLGNDLFGKGASASFALAEILDAAGRTDEAVRSAREAEKGYAGTGCCPEALARVRSWLAARGVQ